MAMNLPDIPLFSLLRQRMSWLNQRQTVLSQKVANADTTGYVARGPAMYSQPAYELRQTDAGGWEARRAVG